jgi:hypothetical protein
MEAVGWKIIMDTATEIIEGQKSLPSFLPSFLFTESLTVSCNLLSFFEAFLLKQFEPR